MHPLQAQLMKRGGYLLETADGLCLTSFSNASDAIRCASCKRILFN